MKKTTAMLTIGVSKETVVAARQAVMEILKCKDADQLTKQTALQVFRDVCEVRNVNVTGCSFHSGESK